MSKLFKKTFRRVSWLNGGTPQYPHGGPEVPNEHSQSFDNLGANGSSRLNGRNVNGVHSGSSRAASQPTVLGTLGEFQAELPEAEDTTSEPITLAVIGAGHRGKAFAEYVRAHSRQCKIIAVAEPRPETRSAFATRFNVSDKYAFASYTDLLQCSDMMVADGRSRLAQGVIICVQDRMHAELTIEFAKRGFHVLCEKPLGVDVEECIRVTEEVENSGIVYALGHNFPYSPYAASLTELIHSGSLGRLLHIAHLEPIGYYHFAHSYVRGNWQSEKTSAPIILTKSSHDLDIFCRWFWPLVPSKVSSFGGLGHFRKERKPAGAKDVMRCLECPASVEQKCEYSAKRIYLIPAQGGMSGWPGSVIVDGRVTGEKMLRALEETSYGLCVYESANDVPDHQTISIQFTNPVDLVTTDSEQSPEREPERELPAINPTVSFSIVAHTDSICMRKTTMYFEHGEIIGDMSTYTVSDFREAARGVKRIIPSRGLGGGHGGGDWALINSWLKAIAQKEAIPQASTNGVDASGSNGPNPSNFGPLGVGASVRDQLRVFLTGFAIEEARKESKVVDCADFERGMFERYSRYSASRVVDAASPAIDIEYEPEMPSS